MRTVRIPSPSATPAWPGCWHGGLSAGTGSITYTRTQTSSELSWVEEGGQWAGRWVLCQGPRASCHGLVNCDFTQLLLAKSKPLPHIPRRHYTTKDELWAHFLRGGAYEGRAHRFTCDYQPQPITTAAATVAAVAAKVEQAAVVQQTAVIHEAKEEVQQEVAVAQQEVAAAAAETEVQQAAAGVQEAAGVQQAAQGEQVAQAA